MKNRVVKTSNVKPLHGVKLPPVCADPILVVRKKRSGELKGGFESGYTLSAACDIISNELMNLERALGVAPSPHLRAVARQGRMHGFPVAID